ncbi:MAG: hypothetical protein HQ567_31090 [Candidatus Nealsonbacteria bacterium]|nr:hypothetical protein [Candidatus Nealsonbacteria bacterium]
MIGRLLRRSGGLLVYSCVGTIMAQAVLAGYVISSWGLDSDKLIQILAIAQGVDLFELHDEAREDLEKVSTEQVSYALVLKERALRVRSLELREQALKQSLGRLTADEMMLLEKTKQFQVVTGNFALQLETLTDEAATTGMTDLVNHIGGLKAPQSKKLLQMMLEREQMERAVFVLKNLPFDKAAKIITEFKTDQELEELYPVLVDMLSEGYPVDRLAADVQEKLKQITP